MGFVSGDERQLISARVNSFARLSQKMNITVGKGHSF